MNTYSQRLGLSSTEFQFHDVYGTDPDLLAMVPSPVLAVLLLFPCTEASGLARQEEAERIERDGQVVDPAVYFCKQTVGTQPCT